MKTRYANLMLTSMLLPCALMAQGTSYKTLYSFQGSPDGSQPMGALLISNSGVLYGTTYVGGLSQLGTVFELIPTQGVPSKEHVIHSFNGSDGKYPQSVVVPNGKGSLYGVAADGGPGGAGAIYQLTPPVSSGNPWTQTVLYSFTYSGDGQNAFPNGPPLIGHSGIVYTTTTGGPNVAGYYEGVFLELVPPETQGSAWTENRLYTFGFSQGEPPVAGMTAAGGALFGTTYDGGDSGCFPYFGCGAVFEMMPPTSPNASWTETTLYYFTGPPDGEFPAAALTAGPNSVLYGTTKSGGTGSCSNMEALAAAAPCFS